MTPNKIIPYKRGLKQLARELRKNSTLAEVLLWQNIKGKSYDYEFHRQVPIKDFIVDFYCHELHLAIEIDGNTHDYNFEKDDARQKELECEGISFIRFTDNEVKRNMIDVLRMLESVISEIDKKKRISADE